MAADQEFDDLIKTAKTDERAKAARLADLQRTRSTLLAGGTVKMTRTDMRQSGIMATEEMGKAEIEVEIASRIRTAEVAWNLSKQKLAWAEGMKRLPEPTRSERLRQHREQEANRAKHEGKPAASEHDKQVRDANEARRQEMLRQQEENRRKRHGGGTAPHDPSTAVPGAPEAPWEARRREMLAEQEANRQRRQGG